MASSGVVFFTYVNTLSRESTTIPVTTHDLVRLWQRIKRLILSCSSILIGGLSDTPIEKCCWIVGTRQQNQFGIYQKRKKYAKGWPYHSIINCTFDNFNKSLKIRLELIFLLLEGVNVSSNWRKSHDCAIPVCINPDDVCWTEPHQINCARRACHKSLTKVRPDLRHVVVKEGRRFCTKDSCRCPCHLDQKLKPCSYWSKWRNRYGNLTEEETKERIIRVSLILLINKKLSFLFF